MIVADLEQLLAEVTPGVWTLSVGHEIRIEPASIKVFRINPRAECDARLIAMSPDLARDNIKLRAENDALARKVEAAAKLVEAIQALGALPEGYCFCSSHRIGDDSRKIVRHTTRLD